MNRIKEIRNDADITQRTLARKVGVTVATIRNWEAGRNEPSTILSVAKLCAALNCQVFDLLERK